MLEKFNKAYAKLIHEQTQANRNFNKIFGVKPDDNVRPMSEVLGVKNIGWIKKEIQPQI